MILVTVASQIEQAPLLTLLEPSKDIHLLVTGVGPVETAFTLTRYLESLAIKPAMIINTGIAGAYVSDKPGEDAAMLDLCLAGSEVFGDFGVQLEDGYLYFDQAMAGEVQFDLDKKLNQRALTVLSAAAFHAIEGVFITVNSASGTGARGRILQRRWKGLCENMEGAAVARLCRYYQIPLLELRAVSNMVEDRDVSGWKIKEAAHKAALAVNILCKAMK